MLLTEFLLSSKIGSDLARNLSESMTLSTWTVLMKSVVLIAELLAWVIQLRTVTVLKCLTEYHIHTLWVSVLFLNKNDIKHTLQCLPEQRVLILSIAHKWVAQPKKMT